MYMFMRQLFSLLCFSFIALSSAAAVEDITQAQQVIERSSEQIKKTLKRPAYQNDFSKATQFVDGVVTKFVDMHRVALLVLGKNIRKATPEQRQRFIHEFKILLVRVYTRAFLNYKEWTITYYPNNDTTNYGKTIIRTLVHQPGKQPVNIIYRMLLNKSDEWKVYEIQIDGVSLVTTYRSFFDQEIARTGSIDVIIKSLIDKNSKVNLDKEH